MIIVSPICELITAALVAGLFFAGLVASIKVLLWLFSPYPPKEAQHP